MQRALLNIAVLLTSLSFASSCNRKADAEQTQTNKTKNGASTGQTTAVPNDEAASNGNGSGGTDKAGDEMRKTQQVLAHARAAEQAIKQGDQQTAMKLLGDMADTLRTMYEGAPGRNVLNKMNDVGTGTSPTGKEGGASATHDKGASSGAQGSAQNQGANSRGGNGNGNGTGPSSEELAPIVADVSEQSVYLDPKVVADVKEAKTQAEQGKSDSAQNNLRLARERMVADIALLPVEDAYARVLAAKEELRAGHKENALQMLEHLPVVVSEVQVSAPLVPARFDLRAAAAAAEDKDWKRASQLVGQAQQQIKDVYDAGGKASSDLQPVVKRADQLRTRIDGKNKPKPAEIRALADELRNRQRTL